MYWESIGNLKDESFLIEYFLQLKLETGGLIIELVFFNGFESYVKLELFKGSYFGSKSWLC